MELNFDFKYKDYELRAGPEHLVRTRNVEPNNTIDFVKWYDSELGPCCYSIAYWKRKSDGYYLKFVGNRFLDIAPKDVPVLWKAIAEAQKVLDEWFEETKADLELSQKHHE